MELVMAVLAERAMKRERKFRDRLDPLQLSDRELLKNYRFPRHELVALFEELEPVLGRRTRRCRAIPTHTQVLVSLRILATGSLQNVIGIRGGLTQSSISRTFRDVTNALFRKSLEEVRMPCTLLELTVAAQNLGQMSSFPRAIGALDATHIFIATPHEDEHLYLNQSKFHSINLQAVCDSDGLFISYNARYPGSAHDSFIWNNSDLKRRFEATMYDDYLLFGDSGYPSQSFQMTSFRNPSTATQERYNEAHAEIHAKRRQAFRVLRSRFRCIDNSTGALNYTPIKCAKIIGSCILLHNRCVKANVPILEEVEVDDEEVDDLSPDDEDEGRRVRDEIVQNCFGKD